jgi:hypothetical protein
MLEVKGFSAGLKAKLDAAGFTKKEIELGAIMAEMQAAMKLIDSPLAAMAVSNTFAKALALLSQDSDTAPPRIVAACDVIFDSAMAFAADKIAALKGRQSGVRTVMSADLDETPAVDPKAVN